LKYCVTFPGDDKPHRPDFTICGAGTAALCLAYSLTNQGYRVLMLEQGKDQSDNELVTKPFDLGTYIDGTPMLNILNSALNPETTSYVGNPDCNGNAFRVEPLVTGRGVGGGGLHWVLEYVEPHPNIVDGPLSPDMIPPVNTSTYSFVDAAGPNWSWSVLHGFIKQYENFRRIDGAPGMTEQPAERGFSGPTGVTQLDVNFPPLGPPAIVQNALSNAAASVAGGAACPVVQDYNVTANLNSTSQVQNFLSLSMVRQNSQTSFANETICVPGPDNSLVGVNDRKLVILCQRSAIRCTKDDCKSGNGKFVAKAVEFMYKNQLYHVNTKNVVASMGAGYSPQFWMRSGFGDPSVLASLGIPKQVSMPLLGQNLQNQYGPSILISTVNPIYSQAFLGQSFVQYNGCPRRWQIIQAGFGPFMPGAIENQVYADSSRYYFYLVGFMLQPRSRGYVTLNDANFGTQPTIQWNFFSDGPVSWQPASGLSDPASDISSACAMFDYMYQVLLQMASQSPADDFRLEFLPQSLFYPGTPEERYPKMVPYLQMFNKPAAHETGTVVMNNDPTKGCVDEHLLMHGTGNCFTCDSSIPPILNSGNTGTMEQAVGHNGGVVIPVAAML
jgi:choline dehydrogenase